MSSAVGRVSSPWRSWLCLAMLLLACSACGDDKTPPTQPSPTPPTPTPPTTVTVTLSRVTQSPTGVGLVLATPFAFTAEFSVSDGSALTYTWDFGDGSRQTGGPSVTHTYGGQGVFPVTVTVATTVGVSAQARAGEATVAAVTGRFGLQDATGTFLLQNSSLNQNGTSISGDDTAQNCRFAVTGSVAPERGITLTWTRAPNDCAGRNLPIAITFTGTVNDQVGGFLGTLDTGGPARLVPCGTTACR